MTSNNGNDFSIENKRILDIGCGIGFYSIYFAANGAKEVVGIDNSQEAINTSKMNAQLNKVSDKTMFLMADNENVR